MSLLARYEEALELTKAQTLAIRAEEWENLAELLASRQLCLEQAAGAISSAAEREKKEAAVLLGKISHLDEANQKELVVKKNMVREELGEMNHADQALGGYRDSFDGPDSPKFFDGAY
ncbi:MAG TPA: hypothetical protein DD435_14505 [Cyanobacteria bacterium UBA8530]|nr:hypothetical protein [Cyanobacteria bacterium UBA8530]